MNANSTIKSLLALGSLALCFSANAQKTNELFIDKITDVVTSQIDVNIRTRKFDTIGGIQGTLVWDTSFIKYSSITYNTASGIVLNNASMNLTGAAAGKISFLWTDPNVTGVSTPDSTIVFSLRFNVAKLSRNCVPISFTNTPTDTLILVIDPNGIPSNSPSQRFTNGEVCFPAQPTISVSGTTLTVAPNTSVAGIQYQWALGNPPFPLLGANSSSYNTSGTPGVYTVLVTYPNGTFDTVSINYTALPVKLSGFIGKATATNNQLTWTTTNEINSNSFDVQYSNNAKEFTTIGNLKALGNSSSSKQYNFAHNSETNISYYRLKMIDNGGAYNYSPIVRIDRASANFFSILTNPVKNNLIIKGTNITEIKIIDANGKTITNTRNQASRQQLEINVSQLAAGTYFVQATSNNGSLQTEKFVK